jgi:hypothetical protein
LGLPRFGLRGDICSHGPLWLFTGRFTAKDPLGYAAGDPDLYGYCLDDPVNAVDPTGLFFMAAPLLYYGLGKLGALGIAAAGTYLAAGVADAAGKTKDKDYGTKQKTAVQGVNEVAPMVGAIQAAGSIVAPAPAGVATAPQLGAAAARSVGAAGGALLDKAKKGYDAAKTAVLGNPEKTTQAAEFAKGVIDPNPPATPVENLGASAKKIYELGKDTFRRR